MPFFNNASWTITIIGSRHTWPSHVIATHKPLFCYIIVSVLMKLRNRVGSLSLHTYQCIWFHECNGCKQKRPKHLLVYILPTFNKTKCPNVAAKLTYRLQTENHATCGFCYQSHGLNHTQSTQFTVNWRVHCTITHLLLPLFSVPMLNNVGKQNKKINIMQV